jgi:hypothetical protein
VFLLVKATENTPIKKLLIVDLDILQRIGYTVIMANSRERLGTTPAAVT